MMTLNEHARLIKLFNVAVIAESGTNFYSPVDPIRLNEMAAKVGYIIHPDACTRATEWFIKGYVAQDINSTFYKNWKSCTKDRREILIDQLIHYAVAYTTGETWVPEPENLDLVPDFEAYTLILPISKEEMFAKCREMVYSGIALKQELIELIGEFIYENRHLEVGFDVNLIKNKEAQAYICAKTNIVPEDKFALLRTLVYSYTCGKTMMINNRDFRNEFRDVTIKGYLNLTHLKEEDLQKLASIFYRYKYVFLAMRKHEESKSIVNRIRRMAKTYHQPMVTGFWEKVVYEEVPMATLVNRLVHDNPSNFKLVSLIQTIRENKMMMMPGQDPSKMYVVRNGKIYVKSFTPEELRMRAHLIEWWFKLEDALMARLVSNLSKKKCVVRFPKYLNLTCPTSEKNFVGNMPFGSYYQMSKNNYIGIYWRNEWGTRDFDLSYVDFNGDKIGWDGCWNRNCNVMFSGDMVDADPEATEILYMKGGCNTEGIVYVNRYNGMSNSKFKLMLGQENLDSLPCGYMVDPNCIQFEEEITSPTEMQQMVGMVLSEKMYMCTFTLGDIRVSGGRSDSKVIESIMRRKMTSFIDLKNILISAGFEEYDAEKHESIDLDLTDLKKDTLISLFNAI